MLLLPITGTAKNIIELINNIYDKPNPEQWILISDYSLSSAKNLLNYLVSLQWIYDIRPFLITPPKIQNSIFIDLANSLFVRLNFKELNLFPSEIVLMQEKVSIIFNRFFFQGFINCFFIYLPFSPVQFLWLRRVVIEGVWSGIAATLGLVLGNISFIAICLFGVRFIINIWINLEPFTYFIGIWFIFFNVFIIKRSPIRLLKRFQYKELSKVFLLNLALSWTDQSRIFPYLKNLSLNDGISFLDLSFDSPKFSVLFYFLGIVVGSFFWTFLIGYGLIKIGSNIPRLTKRKYSFSDWINGFNYFCLIACLVLTMTSFPYYSPNYLFTNKLGFISRDSALKETILSSVKTTLKDAQKGRLGEKSSHSSMDTDLSFFDDGQYTSAPTVEVTIEAFNYQTEYAWRSRFDRVSSYALNRRGGLLDEFLKSKLGPINDALQKQKREKRLRQQILKLSKIREKSKKIILESYPFYSFLTSIMRKKNYLEDYVSEMPSFRILKRNYEDIIERFVENYTAEANTEDSKIPDPPEEKMMRFSAFSELTKYCFDSFSCFEATEQDPGDEKISSELKEKYSDNFVYKFLVSLDIYNFLSNQSKKYKLTSNEEISLFKRRLFLSKYYDTLRNYSKLELFQQIFNPLFNGPKSFANRIYNQQFKGTLKIVERLFSVHLEKGRNVPKFPQPKKQIDQLEKIAKKYYKYKHDFSTLKFDQPLYKKKFLYKNPLIHEQKMKKINYPIEIADNMPFIEEENSFPFFVGWDNIKRKFIITNRLLTRDKTLSNVNIPKNRCKTAVLKEFSENKELLEDKNSESIKNLLDEDLLNEDLSEEDLSEEDLSDEDLSDNNLNTFYEKVPEKSILENFKDNTQYQTLKFITWPVLEKKLLKNNFFTRLFCDRKEVIGIYDDLFKYSEPLMEEDNIIYKKLPTVIHRVEVKDKTQVSLIPRRGGFIWPGNEPLKIKIPLRLSVNLKKMKHNLRF